MKTLAVHSLFFFAALFIGMLLVEEFTAMMFPKHVKLGLLVGTLIVVAALFAMYKSGKVQIDRFHFEVSPEKTCEGGPYMWSSASPEKQAYCNSLSPQQYSAFNCPAGFNGRPVHWQYTPESDSKWQNTRCATLDPNDTRPCVL